jgi:hypothetical protein
MPNPRAPAGSRGQHYGGFSIMIPCMTPQSVAIQRPQAEEHNPYYSRYIDLVPDADILDTLRRQVKETRAIIERLTEEQGNYRYAPGKWSVKEVLGHLSDTERVFGYRALRVARNDQTPIEGFEQDDYVRFGPFMRRPLVELIDEFAAVRQCSILLFSELDEEAWGRRGTANNSVISVRAIAYVMAGHELHHRSVLKEKYNIG